MSAGFTKFAFIPKENEQIEVVIKLPEERRSIIHGIVKDNNNKIIKNAVVKLYKLESSCNPCALNPISHTFTDECGQFLFGPLSPYKQYAIKVWVNNIKISQVIVRPDDLDEDILDIN